MEVNPNLEVGYGMARGEDAFEVGADAARGALLNIREHPLSVILVFAAASYDQERLLQGISSETGKSPLIGATTAGEICNEIHRESVVVVALASPYLRVKVGVGKGVSRDWQQALVEAVTTPAIAPYFSSPDNTVWSILAQEGQSAFAVLFSPDPSPSAGSRCFHILETLQRLSQGRLPVMGASANHNGRPQSNYVFWGPTVSSDSVLVAVFETSLKFGISLAHGFRPSSQQAVVTRSQGCEVLELDGQPAVEVYRRLQGLPLEALKGQNPPLSAGRPLGLADPYGQYRINEPTSFTTGGGVKFTRPVPEGASLTVMEADHDNLVTAGAEALRKALLRGSIQDPGMVLVFSSALRRRILGERTAEEISGMRDLAPQVPMMGLFSFGEQGLADDGVNRHHQQAIAVLALGRELSYAAEVARENRSLRFSVEQHNALVKINEKLEREIAQRRKAEEKLNKSEKLFNSFMKHLPAAALITDCEGHIVYANQGWERIAQKKREEALGKTDQEIWPAELASQFSQENKVVLSTKQGLQTLAQIPHEPGAHTLLVNRFPILDCHGNPVMLGMVGIDVTEQKQLKETLRETTDTLGALINASPLAIYVLDREGLVQMWNPASERFYGWSAAEAIGRVLPSVPEDKLDHFYETHQRVLKGESLAGMEVRARRKDGSPIDIRVYAAPLFDAQGQVTTVMVLNADITDRKQAREALSKSEATLRSIFKAAPIGIALVDKRIMGWVNEQMTKMTGYAADELVGQSTRMLYENDAEFERVGQKAKESRARRGKSTMETRWKAKDGRMLDVLVSSSPVDPAEPDGEVIFTGMDITESKQAEETFKSLVYNAPIGIFITQGGKFKLVNPGFLKLTGYNEEDLVGEDALRYVPSEFKEMVRTQAIQMLKGQRSAPYEFQIVTKDGETRWMVETVTPIQYDGKRATLGFFLDVNERTMLENQLLQAQKMEAVGRLAGGVAHDFNNMLTAIMGYCEIVMMSFREGDPIFLHLEGIRKSADRAATLTRQLLAFSRKQLLQPRVTNLNTVITDLEKMLRRLIGEDINLIIDLDPALKEVKADPGQIEQVIMNLVINARDAMPLGGKLVIQSANVYLDEAYTRPHADLLPGPYTKISVIDNGLGMDPETLAHIFEPFFTTKEAGKGTGLGLSTVYGIIKQSGGHIEVSSQIGRGTVFEIYLRQMEEPVGKSLGKPAVTAPIHGSETVLVVEDEEILLDLIKDALEMHGYHVLAAHNGMEAIELCQQYAEPIHLMLTDVVMPHKNGRQLAEYLSPLHPEMKILYMSGYTEDAMVVRGLVEAALPFIQKPFPPMDLVRKVREMIDNAGD